MAEYEPWMRSLLNRMKELYNKPNAKSIAEALPEVGSSGGEVTPASIVTATEQMNDGQKFQTRYSLGAVSMGEVECVIRDANALIAVPMTVNGGNLVLDLETWGGIGGFADAYHSGMNAVFALPMYYLDETAADSDILTMQMIGSDTYSGVLHFEGVRSGKRYYARMAPISENVLSGPLVITDNTTTPASIITATGQMTEAQQAWMRQNIGAGSVNPPDVVDIISATPTIEPKDNEIYKCGELTSLTISNPPATGKYSIIFFSGANPTATVGIANFAAEANKRYKITVEDGYATYDSWGVS